MRSFAEGVESGEDAARIKARNDVGLRGPNAILAIRKAMESVASDFDGQRSLDTVGRQRSLRHIRPESYRSNELQG